MNAGESTRDYAYLYSHARVLTTTNTTRSLKSPTRGCFFFSTLHFFIFLSVAPPFKIRRHIGTPQHALEGVRTESSRKKNILFLTRRRRRARRRGTETLSSSHSKRYCSGRLQTTRARERAREFKWLATQSRRILPRLKRLIYP